jgi:putative ABC transport system permease protein
VRDSSCRPLAGIGLSARYCSHRLQAVACHYDEYLRGIVLLLAAIGKRRVVSYQVARRAREIGIRMALGATRADILRSVIQLAMTPVAVGLAVGLAAALLLTRWIQSMLFGVGARDPGTMVAIVVALAAVALAGCALPARRAARIDPIEALRSE